MSQVRPSRPGVSPFIVHTPAESGAYERAPPLSPAFCDIDYDDKGVHIYRQPPMGQFRVYQVTQLITDGVYHRRESAGTGPVVLKVVRVTGAAFSGITVDQFSCPCIFPPTIGTAGMCGTEDIGLKVRIDNLAR